MKTMQMCCLAGCENEAWKGMSDYCKEHCLKYRPVWASKFADAPEPEPTPPELSMLELVDGAYDIVELWPALTPVQKIWKKKWLECARKHGANPSR